LPTGNYCTSRERQQCHKHIGVTPHHQQRLDEPNWASPPRYFDHLGTHHHKMFVPWCTQLLERGGQIVTPPSSIKFHIAPISVLSQIMWVDLILTDQLYGLGNLSCLGQSRHHHPHRLSVSMMMSATWRPGRIPSLDDQSLLFRTSIMILLQPQMHNYIECPNGRP
jgi:hypothetical protein